MFYFVGRFQSHQVLSTLQTYITGEDNYKGMYNQSWSSYASYIICDEFPCTRL